MQIIGNTKEAQLHHPLLDNSGWFMRSIMANVKFNDFWDKGTPADGSGCILRGEEANYYHDPRAYFVGSSGMALVNGRYGATMIPRATPLGGSRGFDAHKPKILRIDPDIPGQSCSVDLTKINKALVTKAFKQAQQDSSVNFDPRLRAAETYHILSKMVKSDVDNIPLYNENARILITSASPRSDIDPLIGSVRGIQEEIGDEEFSKEIEEYQQVKKKATVQKMITREDIRAKISSKQEDTWVSPVNPITPPQLTVRFNMEGWGELEAVYHDVIITDQMVILAYDTRFKAGTKYFPSVNDNKLLVTVDDVTYPCKSYGLKFEHNDHEYYMLVVVDEEEDNKEE